ncbi:MAG: CinA family protein [Chloroflexi bacterium]|nr:CinA family protein [Chloroflexota bacterium]
MGLYRLAAEVIAELRARNLTLATGESSAGGLIGHLLTEVPGSSQVFVGGAVVYHNRLKEEIGVSSQTLERHGAVSKETVEEMATATRRWAGTDIGLAETGIAGPKGVSEDRPAGLFFIAVASADGVVSERLMLDGDRSQNKLHCAESALRLLLRYVEGDA